MLPGLSGGSFLFGFGLYIHCIPNSCGILYSPQQPASDVACLFVEINAYLHLFPVVCCIRNEVFFVVYLLQGLFGSAVELEFEDVDVIFVFYHHVGPSVTAAHFDLGILSQQGEYDVKDVVVVPFRVIAQFV